MTGALMRSRGETHRSLLCQDRGRHAYSAGATRMLLGEYHRLGGLKNSHSSGCQEPVPMVWMVGFFWGL